LLELPLQDEYIAEEQATALVVWTPEIPTTFL
jgi:hypothetical protein